MRGYLYVWRCLPTFDFFSAFIVIVAIRGCVTIRRDMNWISGFIDHLYTALGTTGNYSAIAGLHNSQFTTATTKLLPACCVLTSIPWQRLLTVEILQLPALRSLLRRLSFRTACQLSTPELSVQFSAAKFQLPTISLPSLLDYSANYQLRRLSQLSSTADSQLNRFQAGGHFTPTS
jgi:hypothetical protein